MPKNPKQTSKKVASTASRLLRSKRTSKSTRSVAASALAQAPKKRKK